MIFVATGHVSIMPDADDDLMSSKPHRILGTWHIGPQRSSLADRSAFGIPFSPTMPLKS
jgi:hypothetical protein